MPCVASPSSSTTTTTTTLMAARSPPLSQSNHLITRSSSPPSNTVSSSTTINTTPPSPSDGLTADSEPPQPYNSRTPIRSLPSHLFNHHRLQPTTGSQQQPNSFTSTPSRFNPTTTDAATPPPPPPCRAIMVHPATPLSPPTNPSANSLHQQSPSSPVPHSSYHQQRSFSSSSVMPSFFSPPVASTTQLSFLGHQPLHQPHHRPSHQKARSETDMGYRSNKPTIRKKSGEPLRSSLKMPGISTPLQSPPLPQPPGSTRPLMSLAGGATYDDHFSNSQLELAKSAPCTPTAMAKFVHFDAHLEHVRHFLAQQRPIAVSRDGSPIEETETEGEDDYPFPPSMMAIHNAPVQPPSALPNHRVVNLLHTAQDSFPGYVALQSLELNITGREILGRVGVRNLAFEKLVVARFTFDEWRTVSEVTGEYLSPDSRPDWDLFSFRIRIQEGGAYNPRRATVSSLEDSRGRRFIDGVDKQRLERKQKMWLALRYKVNGQEWWDNNQGSNYLVKIGNWNEPSISSTNSSTPVEQSNNSVRGVSNQSGLVGGVEEDVRTSNRMLELRAKLDRLVGDDLELRKVPTSPPNRTATKIEEVESHSNGNQPRALNALTATNQLKKANGLIGTGGLSARYDFGLSLKEAGQKTTHQIPRWNGGGETNLMGFHHHHHHQRERFGSSTTTASRTGSFGI